MTVSPARRLRLATVLLTGAAALAGCTTMSDPVTTQSISETQMPAPSPEVAARYASFTDHDVTVPRIDLSKMDPKYLRQMVDYQTHKQPGTIVIDRQKRFLYLVMPDGKAMRYGVGVGKAGMQFTGKAEVGYKRVWPHWTPTKDMIKRDPKTYAEWKDGMAGGAGNPLGARALYLFKNGKDTLFRIHGTTEPWSIGKAMSSGCIRMLDQDVIDLYSRVPAGAKVDVL